MLEPDIVNLLDVQHLSTVHPSVNGTPAVQAVSDVSFSLAHGEVLGIVGESGCGKSTLARTVLRLCDSTDGTIRFDGKDITRFSRREMKSVRRDMQVVFQDPYGSLNPRHTVARLLSEPLHIHALGTDAERHQRVLELMSMVGLPHSALDRLPHEFSGGQRQRIAIARALALKPKLLIADEAVSALDVSVQSQIINLIARFREHMRLSILFISHDLSVVRHVSNRVAVMYLGRIVETGPTDAVLKNPAHPYTQALVSAVPGWQDVSQSRIILRGDMPDPARPPVGCAFNTRCQHAFDQCVQRRPELTNVMKTGNALSHHASWQSPVTEHRRACFLDDVRDGDGHGARVE